MPSRHDTITLLADAKEPDFEKFMTDELIPFFSQRYKGPTRSSRADIQGQSVLKTIGQSRKYLWENVMGWRSGLCGGRKFQERAHEQA